MLGTYILDLDGTPLEVNDPFEWSKFMNSNRRLKKDTFPNGVWVSTVFLGLDYSFGEGPPILWETMIFGATGDLNDYRERYTTAVDALEGHERACELVRKAAV